LGQFRPVKIRVILGPYSQKLEEAKAKAKAKIRVILALAVALAVVD